jgi:transcription elongation factor GreA
MDRTDYLSKEKYEELEEKLKYLKTEKSQEIAKRLKEAKELGDLSENSEYHEARNAKNELEKEINNLENTLRNSELIKKSKNNDKVNIGSSVEVEKEGKKISYEIVGSSESDPSKGKISNESPLGEKLLGKRKGDKIKLYTPKGEKILKILKIN